jgi:isopenicillin N synthase-like dioxygenase
MIGMALFYSRVQRIHMRVVSVSALHSNCSADVKTTVSRLAQDAMFDAGKRVKLLDLLPSQRNGADGRFREVSQNVLNSFNQGFVVLELPTADKQKLSLAHGSLMSYRCKASFEGTFLSARHLPQSHALRFKAGGTPVLRNEELPPAEDGWTPACQTEAYQAMHALKTASICVLDTISYAMGLGFDTLRRHLVEDELPLKSIVSNSSLHVLSYATAASSVKASEAASEEVYEDRGILAAIYSSTPGLQVQHWHRRKRVWADVPFGHDIVILMVGYTLEHASAGFLRAAVHRVQPSTSIPGQTLLSFKLRAPSTATLPCELIIPRRDVALCENEEDITIGVLMQKFSETHGRSSNGTRMISLLDEQHAQHHVWDYRTVYVKYPSGETAIVRCDTLQCTVVASEGLLQRNRPD